MPMTANSLVVETTDTAGSALSGVKVYAKGGYKRYTTTTDTSYYYDNMSPSDTRVTTDANGMAAIANLVPFNSYIFCGDLGDSNCKIGNTTYYLAAAVPYGGTNSLSPITVPPYPIGNPPAMPYPYGASNYVQKVRLMLTTNANFPRLFSMSPYQLSLASGNLDNVLVTFTGKNLSGATTTLESGSQSYTGTSCQYSTATSPAYDLLKCSFDLTGAVVGSLQLSVANGAGALTLPTTPLGGFDVVP
jgi:hypothetical protein